MRRKGYARQGEPDDHLHGQHGPFVPGPLGKGLVRKPIGMQTDVSLIVGKGQVDQEDDREVHHHEQADGEEPVPAHPPGQRPDSCRGPRESQRPVSRIAQA